MGCACDHMIYIYIVCLIWGWLCVGGTIINFIKNTKESWKKKYVNKLWPNESFAYSWRLGVGGPLFIEKGVISMEVDKCVLKCQCICKTKFFFGD